VLLAQLTAQQWEEWKVVYAMDPWGEWRQDRRFAMIAQLLMATKGKKSTVDDFMLFDPEKKQRKQGSQRQQVKKLRGWFETMAARGSK
jgi:endoglucanase Acf2